MKKSLIITVGSLVVVGIVLYGSISLYSKLNKVDELNQRIEETADFDTSQDSNTDPSLVQEEENQPKEPSQTEQVQEDKLQSTSVENETPSPSPNNVDTSEKPTDDAKSTEDNVRKKQEIDAAITADLQQLKASCQASSSSLVQQITQELGKNDEAALEMIQNKYLTKVFAAEAECDAQFNQLISKAKSEYSAADLSDQPLPDWSTQYESAKAQARADAITVISNAVQ
ncbi:hypothetical protein [Paenibacillus prosopidis]|uniref:Uncharacterized protein n=1 Tax=Paenibacillus prosopidis TaxID=630520 RepID=A0A368W4T9_9BACL|nr:hypothetical protein [Paenibacillus prosopidis]RCW47876.1 hypothetical protein DFP97_10775 [Paenibacillus prosopidis]